MKILFKHPKLKNLKVESSTIFSYILVMKEIGIDSSFLDKIEKLFNDEDYKSILELKYTHADEIMTIVMDEYGGVAGLITLEDIVE